MDSREFGLVAGQQLTGMEDLHYGLWEEGEIPSILGAKEAQNRYTKMILGTIEQYGGEPATTKILDVGCGTGVILKELLRKGYQVDGVIPAAYLKKQVDQRIAELDSTYQPAIYECNFQDFPQSDRNNQYDIVLFSESYQYIPMGASFALIKKLLKSDGKVIICDFFKSEHDGDGGPGDKSFGGGHALDQFYRDIESYGYTIVHDDDITKRISPTIAMVDEILMQRIYPTLQTLSAYLEGRHRFGFGIFKRLFRKKMAKLKFKYFSGHRSQAVFERYKSYHHVVLGLK
ncbi:MAG: class I SAM-dependent methyltransferase [Acidiferrobacterales bacterium]